MSTQRASACLLSRIARAALKEFRTGQFYVAEAPPGVVLTDAQLELLQKPEDDWLDEAGAVGRLVEMSRLVDCIQRDGRTVNTPTREPEFLTDVFPRLLDNVSFLPAPLTVEARQRYEQALNILYQEAPFVKTAAYHEFCLLRADLEKKDVVMSELGLTLNATTNTEQQAALAAELGRLQELAREGRELLDGLERLHAFRVAEETVDAAERAMDSVPPSIGLAVSALDLTRITDPVSLESHYRCSFFPPHLGGENWAPLRLTQKDIASMTGWPSHDAGTGGADELDDAQIESIELEVQTIVCERPWLWSALFANPRWTFATPSKAVARGGDVAADDGLIPAYIHALVFVRNLTVRGVASAASPSGGVAFAKVAMLSAATPSALPSNDAKGAAPGLLMRALEKSPPAALASSNPSRAPAAAVVSKTPVAKAIGVTSRLTTAAKAGAMSQPVKPLSTSSALLSSSHDNPARGIFSSLLPRYSVTGRVVDGAGRGIAGASLTLTDAATRRVIRSGSDGTYRLASLFKSKYQLHVVKAGFQTHVQTVVVPGQLPKLITLTAAANSKLVVRMIERYEAGERPFSGTARVNIKSGRSSRLETMNGTAEATFLSTAGRVVVSVSSNEAESISPATLTLELTSDKPAVATFTLRRAPLLQNSDVQLLAFVCRRVPRCPVRA